MLWKSTVPKHEAYKSEKLKKYGGTWVYSIRLLAELVAQMTKFHDGPTSFCRDSTIVANASMSISNLAYIYLTLTENRLGMNPVISSEISLTCCLPLRLFRSGIKWKKLWENYKTMEWLYPPKSIVGYCSKLFSCMLVCVCVSEFTYTYKFKSSLIHVMSFNFSVYG